MKTVSISIKDLNVLRETFKKASELLEAYGVTGDVIAPSAAPRETKKQREQKYASLIEGKTRVKKPDYLKKKNGRTN